MFTRKDRLIIVAMFRIVCVCFAALIGDDMWKSISSVMKNDFVAIKEWGNFPEDLV